MNEDEYEDIERTHVTKGGKETPVKIRYFPNRQITTITQTTEDPETKELKDETIQEGMSKEEIEKYFPSDKFHPKETFDKKHLISSILYEAYLKEGIKDLLEPGNRRHFWYSHLKPILLGTMGCSNDPILESTIGHAWTSLVETDLITYEEMNIYSAKETGRLSNIKDSPYYNIIIGIEKQSYFKGMTRLPQLFYCTLITAGGQPSTGVLRRFFSELKALGVDLNQTFHLCIASDFDPSGIDIEETFTHKIIGAIKYNGGDGNVVVHRVFVRKEQITDTLLKSQGIPYSIKKVSIKAIKQAETNWRKFVQKTGGLYLPKPEGWGDSSSGVEITKPDVDGEGKEGMIRGILEMDAFSSTIVENVIGRELLKIIRDNDLDETKIMIPEIMRVFEEKKEGVAEETYAVQDKELIQPLRDDFEEDISDWEDEINNEKSNSEYDINIRYDSALNEKDKEKLDQEPELYDELYRFEEKIELFEDERDNRTKNTKETYDRLIEELYRLRNTKVEQIENEYRKPIDDLKEKYGSVEEEIDEACEVINQKIEELEESRDEELEDVEEDYDFRMEKYNKFKEEHLATFNPIEEALREDIKNKIDTFDYRYRVLECRGETRENLSDCYNNRMLLIEENISVFMHPTPAFKVKRNLLEMAFENKDLNIGKVRDSFSSQLMEGMKDVIRNDMRHITFEIDKIFERPDLSKEMEKAKEETEKELLESKKGGDQNE